MELDDLIGPLPAPLGRWMLRRLVAGGVTGRCTTGASGNSGVAAKSRSVSDHAGFGRPL